MNKVFGEIKTKKAESLSREGLSNNSLSDEALRDAVDAATSTRKMVGVWDPEISAAMQYLKNTTPRFSISKVAAGWIREGLEKDHPEVIAKVREEMRRGGGLE